MSTTRRRTPLQASGDTADPLDAIDVDGIDNTADAVDVGEAVHHPHLANHTEQERRAFADAVRMLRTGGQSLNLSERTLMVAAGIVAPLGLLFVLLGWYGASRTPNDFEQIPYLISGGLFGLGLVFLGAFFYFAHWLTELVKESRAGSAALLEAVARLQETIADGNARSGHAAGDGDVELVATAQGAMAHRIDCAVVVGKDDLRHVTEADGLAPCKMCDPYLDAVGSDASV